MFNEILGLASAVRIPQLLCWKHLSSIKTNLTVLLYHRVNSNQFKHHMKLLRQHFHIRKIDALVHALAQGNFPANRTAVITFDDGFENFYLEAYPIIKRMKIPVTVYVPTAIIDSEMWTHPEFGYEMIHNAPIHDPRMPHGEKPENRADALQKGYEVKRGMSRNQVIEMDRNPMVTVGGHTISHQELPKLSYKQACREVAKSKKRLEYILGHKIAHFAYPRGKFTPRDIRIVRESSFETGASVIDAWVDENSSIYAFPRLWAGPMGAHRSWIYHALSSWRTPNYISDFWRTIQRQL